MKRLLLYILLTTLVLSCGSKKKIVTKKTKQKTEHVKVTRPKTPPSPKPTPKYNSTEAYIKAFTPIAVKEMKDYGIPASITLAQGILESGSGKGRLAVEANNHFGIKCHDWRGKKIYHDDDEDQECFRKYTNAEESFKDHSEFLKYRKRYSKLFKLRKNDYKSWAKELRKAGYATDRRYPEKLISLIERYKLYKVDALVLGEDYNKDSKVARNLKEHIVQKGDTLYSISKKYNLTVKQLQELNALHDYTISIGQVLKIK